MTVPLLDFSTLSEIPKAYKDAQRQAVRERTLAELGQASGPLDFANAARKLVAAGDLQAGISLAQIADARMRDERDFGFRREEATRAQGNTDRSFVLQERQVNTADARDTRDFGLRREQFDNTKLTQSPEHAANRERAVQTVQAEFAPKTSVIKLPDGSEVTAVRGPNGFTLPVVQGLPPPDPNIPPGVDPKAYREARTKQLTNIDDKAVLEADKNVQAGTSAIQSLNRALELSKTAFAGPLADKRGYVASLTGPGAGADTQELANVVTNQALETLRATFGGNPTEGERKILLDVQGAVSQSQDVRERIYQNAMRAVTARTEFYKNVAEQMRSGKYLLPESQRNPQPQATSAAPTPFRPDRATVEGARANRDATINEARQAIAAGADKAAVVERLRRIGVDPAGL